MKIVIIQDDLFGYLQHVVKAYAGSGIDPDEGLAVYQLNQVIKNAQSVDDEGVAKIVSGELNGVPVTTVATRQSEGG